MKMGTFQWFVLHIGIAFITQLIVVEADYLVAIRIQDFTTTCDDCGTYFRYCIQSLSGAEQCLESHQHVQPGILLDFSQEYLLLRENPLIFRGPTKEWEGAKIYLAALDRNSPQGNSPLIEARINLTLANIQLRVETAHTTFIGPMGHSNLTLSFLVRCAENWYGDDCNTWCQSNCKTLCDQPVSCHDDCLGVVCGENRHCVDGKDLYVCTCDKGFAGRRCEINVDECVGVNCSGNGRCSDTVNSFYCDCDLGYSGTFCEVAIVDSLFTVNEKTLPYLITAIIGWGILITLILILIITVIFTKLKKRLTKNCRNNRLFHNRQGGPIITSFSNGCTQENVSYRAIAPEGGTNISVQMPAGIAATTRVDISHGETDNSMIYNHAYEKGPDVVYEHIA